MSSQFKSVGSPRGPGETWRLQGNLRSNCTPNPASRAALPDVLVQRRGTGDGGESQLSSVLTGSAVDRNTTVLQVHCPLCPLTGPLTSSFLQRLTERQHEEQISTLGGDLQIFEVFQVFKSPPGDASYVVVVEKSVEKRDVAVRRRADQDKYPGVNSLQQFHKTPPPKKTNQDSLSNQQ